MRSFSVIVFRRAAGFGGVAGGIISSNPYTPVSSERIAFCRDSLKVRPIAITSPTDFICVPITSSVWGNFSNVNRGIFVTT